MARKPKVRPVAGSGKPVSPEELLGEAAVVPPALPDPAEELAMAIHHYTIDMLVLCDYLGQVGTIRGLEQHLAGPKRLTAAIERYEDRTFNLEAGLTRVLKAKTKLPAEIAPLRERITHTLKQLGWDVRTFWRQYNKEFGPRGKDARRQEVHTATKA
jgi:hypothetical protein